jgi:hypothetical protein
MKIADFSLPTYFANESNNKQHASTWYKLCMVPFLWSFHIAKRYWTITIFLTFFFTTFSVGGVPA